MKNEKSFLARWDEKLDAIGGRLKDKEVTLPVEMIGAGLFLVLAVVVLLIMPNQVMVSEAEVINGRMFPRLLMIIMIVCCIILLGQGMYKKMNHQPLPTCTLNLLTEVKALIIMAILFFTYLICRLTDLFVLGGVFCAVSFLLYFRCRNRLYYAITIGMAVLVWVAFRFGLGVRF